MPEEQQGVVPWPDAVLVFSLASPEGGEGRGEEVVCFPAEIPSPHPSPRLGGAREQEPWQNAPMRLCEPQQFDNHFRFCMAAAHRAALLKRICVYLCASVVKDFSFSADMPEERQGVVPWPDTVPVFSLASPEGGEGRGEEVFCFPAEIPSPHPSPRLGGAREQEPWQNAPMRFMAWPPARGWGRAAWGNPGLDKTADRIGTARQAVAGWFRPPVAR